MFFFPLVFIYACVLSCCLLHLLFLVASLLECLFFFFPSLGFFSFSHALSFCFCCGLVSHIFSYVFFFFSFSASSSSLFSSSFALSLSQDVMYDSVNLKDQIPERTCEEHRAAAEKWISASSDHAREIIAKETGFRYTPFLRLQYQPDTDAVDSKSEFDTIRQHVVDPMHNLYLGLVKEFFTCMYMPCR
jgi:hypothetical protein